MKNKKLIKPKKRKSRRKLIKTSNKNRNEKKPEKRRKTNLTTGRNLTELNLRTG